MVPLPTFRALWAINDDLDRARLIAQLDDFAAAGLHGVVFHPRNYPNRPRYLGDEYLAIVSDVIEAAAERGLDFWIYDENGWPSGTVDGRLLTEHPHLRQSWVERWPRGEAGAPGELLLTRAGWDYRRVAGDGVDYLNHETAEQFLRLCYQRYADGLRPEAFARVAGFFSDEPELGLGHAQHLLSPHGAIPWTPGLPAAYAARSGVDLIDALPALFDANAAGAEARVHFWELVTDLFAGDYLARLDGWCAERGLVFTAHVKGEEHPLFQVPTSGSLGPVARRVALPGVDALGRAPGNDFFPRLVSSASRQFGSGAAMAEAFGGAGWGATPDDLERYLRWLGRNGITDFVMHIAQYRLDSAAIEDWPPSQPRHLSWRDVYPEVLARVASGLSAEPRPTADTLLVVPQRGIQAVYSPAQFVGMNVHDARDYAGSAAGEINGRFLARVAELAANGVAFDLVDERTLERDGRVAVLAPSGADGGHAVLHVGAQTYRRVEVAEGALLDAGMRAALGPLLAAPIAGGAPARVAPSAPPIVVARVEWSLGEAPVNELPLEAVPITGGWQATFDVGGFRGEAVLVFADDPVRPTLDGVAMPGGRKVRVEIARPGEHVLAFGGVPPASRPHVWLRGRFRVQAVTPVRLRGEIAEIAGGFRVEPARSDIQAELTADGLPFVFSPLRVRGRFHLDRPLTQAALVGAFADAARIDGVWQWGAVWRVRPLPAGDGELEVDLVPNSLNRYGPRHYYSGDPHVVSPAQMAGVRNYADVDEAPPRTGVGSWMLRRLRLPSGLAVLPSPAVDNDMRPVYSDPACESIHIPHEGVTA